MRASSVTRSVLAGADVRSWAWWQLPPVLRCYVGAAPLAMLGVIAYALPNTAWHLDDLLKFLLLLGCALVSVAGARLVETRFGAGATSASVMNEQRKDVGRQVKRWAS